MSIILYKKDVDQKIKENNIKMMNLIYFNRISLYRINFDDHIECDDMLVTNTDHRVLITSHNKNFWINSKLCISSIRRLDCNDKYENYLIGTYKRGKIIYNYCIKSGLWSYKQNNLQYQKDLDIFRKCFLFCDYVNNWKKIYYLKQILVNDVINYIKSGYFSTLDDQIIKEFIFSMKLFLKVSIFSNKIKIDKYIFNIFIIIIKIDMIAESIPPPSKIESLQAITKLPPTPGCEFCVYTFALNKDIVDANGKVDDFRGMFFILGTFDTLKKAEDHIKNLIIKTGHSEFYCAKYGKPIPIQTKIDGSNVSKIHVDADNKIKELETEKYKENKELYEKQIKLEKDLTKETKDEYDRDHIEHFKRQCYLAIKSKSTYETRKKEMDKSLDDYNKNVAQIREHYAKHPEHEVQWLPYLKDKLTERGELNMYNIIASSYEKYRDELLGI